MPHFVFSGWDGGAQAAEALVPNLIPAAGLTIPVGRRAIIRRMDGFNNRTVSTIFWLSRNAMAAANHIASITIGANDGQSFDTYVYIDATAAAVAIVLSNLGNNASAATFSCSGYWE